MPNRLKPLNQFDFTGGVNLRPETFQLLENELPDLLNMEIDPRGGLNCRKGWKATMATAVTTDLWDPRNAYAHVTSLGDRYTLVANRDTTPTGSIHGKVNAGNFSKLSTGSNAWPHQADFASWGDLVWMSRGSAVTQTWNGTTVESMVASEGANWQNDYSAPGGAHNAPKGNLIAQHAGYLFIAGTTESSVAYPNRIRWSHPNNPYAWALNDYIDLSEGGQKITAILPYSDRLLIFKPDSVWALFGYDAETWELTNISRTVGCVHQQAICRNENGVFFVCWPQGIFAYSERGNVTELSVPIRIVFQSQWIDPAAVNNMWLGWVDRRLWCSIPFEDNPPAPDDARTVFVWDPVLTEAGAWMMFRGADNCVPGPYIERADVRDDSALHSFIRQFPYLAELNAITDSATDECDPGHVHGFPSRMRTRWIDAGAPTWKKSWRRPDILMRALRIDTTINCRVFHNYDASNAERSFQVVWTPDNPSQVYGDPTLIYGAEGLLYGGSDQTTSVERGGTMGRAGAVQLLIEADPGISWGLNGIVFKYIPRRFR